jgi:cation diffusion facilitator family transporter
MTDTTRQVQRVFLITLALNLAVALAKIIAGVFSGALSVLADGFHSLTDGASNVVALLALRYADKPADADHPYGHRRIETLAALFIGALLLSAGVEVISGAAERLMGGGAALEITPLTFVVLIGTLLINVFVSRYQKHEAERLRSQVLLADAENTGADVWVTLSVMASLLIAALGWTWVDIPAALIVTVLIARAAWRILRSTSSVLIDTAPYTPERLTEVVERVPSVRKVLRARSRGTTEAAHLDIDVLVKADTTAEQTAALRDAIQQELEREIDGISEVEVHFTPDESARDYPLIARAAADPLGLSVHAVRMTDERGAKTLEMHVEVPQEQTLESAHAQVSQLERDLRARLPEIADVITHIEPANDALEENSVIMRQAAALAARSLSLVRQTYPQAGWHAARAYPRGHGYALTMHVTMPPETPISDAHQLAENATTLLRAHLPELERVTIHTEPHDHE